MANTKTYERFTKSPSKTEKTFDYDDAHWPRGRNHESTPNSNHWTVTSKTTYERYRRPRANIIVSSTAAAAAAGGAADRAVKALRRGQVRDAEEEEQRHQQHGVNADTTRLHGVRPTLNPSLDSNDVSRLLTLGQGRKTCSSKRRGTWRIRPASPLFSGL